MQTKKTGARLLAVLAASTLLGACAVQAQSQAGEPADATLTLVHRFDIPARLVWGAISIRLSPGGWRVGHVDGPAASEAQLRTALSDLGAIELGGRCAGWVAGATSYPCGFALRGLDLAGAVADRFTGMAADGQTQATQRQPMAAQAAGAGLISPVLGEPRFIALRAPSRYLGDKGGAFGGKLEFSFRAVSNALLPSQFDRSSGLVILRAGQRGLQTRTPAGERVGST